MAEMVLATGERAQPTAQARHDHHSGVEHGYPEHQHWGKELGNFGDIRAHLQT